MFSKFNEESRKVLINAKKEMLLLKHPFVGSEHVLLAILANKNSKVTMFLKTVGLDYSLFKKEIINIVGEGTEENKLFLYTPMLKRIIESAIINSKEKEEEVTVDTIFTTLLKEGDGVAIRIMLGMGIDLNVLYDEFFKGLADSKNKSNKKLFLLEFGVDLVEKALNNELDLVIGRDEELERIIQILSRKSKNNPLLIGEAGVGKTAIVEELATRIANRDVPRNLLNKKIISIASSSLVAGTKYRGEFEERINKLIKEAENNDDIILFIDEIHTIMGAGGAEGAIDAANILKPSLARGKLKLIGATTTFEYKQYIEKDRAFDRRLQPIYVSEASKESVYKILKEIRPIYETFHHVLISDEILEIILQLSNNFMQNRKQPDKAIDILDEVCALGALKKDKKDEKIKQLNMKLKKLSLEKELYIKKENYEKSILIRQEERKIENQLNKINLQKLTDERKNITKEMVNQIVHFKTKIPLHMFNKDTNKLNLEFKKLKTRIIGQENIIDELSLISNRILLGLKTNNRPFSILFCGSSGVGKTEIAKEFANIYGGDNSLIKLDMSEYKEAHSISKLIGSPAGYVGYSDNKNIFEEIKNKPYSVILLDEIERAHPNIMNLFLQILDEGKVRDAKGEIIYFNNTVIIMTSNIGFSKEKIGFTNKDNVFSSLKENFSVEFLNRIEKVLIFNKLSEENIINIVNQKIEVIKNRLKSCNVKIIFNETIKNSIVRRSNYMEFGARKIEKLIEEEIDKKVIDDKKIQDNKINV